MTIKEIREGNHLTQQQVADAVGITSTAYARIERGEAKLEDCKYSTVMKLVDVLGKGILGGNNMKTEIQIVVITDYIEYDKCEIACGFYTLEEAQRYIDDGDEYDKECSRIAYADAELNELSLSVDDIKELADRIGSSDSWNSDEDLKAICNYAGLLEEWKNADGENFEALVYKAAKILGVEI